MMMPSDASIIVSFLRAPAMITMIGLVAPAIHTSHPHSSTDVFTDMPIDAVVASSSVQAFNTPCSVDRSTTASAAAAAAAGIIISCTNRVPSCSRSVSRDRISAVM